MTRKVVSPIALDRSINTTEQTPRNIADVLAQQLAAIKTAIETGNGNLEAAFVCYYGVTTATQIREAIEDGKVPYFYYNGVVAQLWKVETDKYTFRTTNTRSVEGQTILDVVDYVVNGSVWSTVTREVSGGSSSGQSYIASVNSLADFDTTGKSGMQDLVSVANVPADGVYQVSVMLHITPKNASATKSDLVLQFTSSDNTGWPSHTFHAVVDDSQTFAQQLSFSTSVSLKAGQNTLRIQCGGLNTEYLVFVDELTVAQLVNGVYHNGDDFADVHTLTEAADFNNDDGVLVDGATGGPRFMLWQTLANKVLGFIKSLSTTITSFRTGDVIPVDGPDGTAKMSKDALLSITTSDAVHNLGLEVLDTVTTDDGKFINSDNLWENNAAAHASVHQLAKGKYCAFRISTQAVFAVVDSMTELTNGMPDFSDGNFGRAIRDACIPLFFEITGNAGAYLVSMYFGGDDDSDLRIYGYSSDVSMPTATAIGYPSSNGKLTYHPTSYTDIVKVSGGDSFKFTPKSGQSAIIGFLTSSKIDYDNVMPYSTKATNRVIFSDVRVITAPSDAEYMLVTRAVIGTDVLPTYDKVEKVTIGCTSPKFVDAGLSGCAVMFVIPGQTTTDKTINLSKDIFVTDYQYVSYSVTANYSVMFIKLNRDFTEAGNSGWLTGSGIYSVETRYFRLYVKKTGGGTIKPTDGYSVTLGGASIPYGDGRELILNPDGWTGEEEFIAGSDARCAIQVLSDVAYMNSKKLLLRSGVYELNSYVTYGTKKACIVFSQELSERQYENEFHDRTIEGWIKPCGYEGDGVTIVKMSDSLYSSITTDAVSLFTTTQYSEDWSTYFMTSYFRLKNLVIKVPNNQKNIIAVNLGTAEGGSQLEGLRIVGIPTNLNMAVESDRPAISPATASYGIISNTGATWNTNSYWHDIEVHGFGVGVRFTGMEHAFVHNLTTQWCTYGMTFLGGNQHPIVLEAIQDEHNVNLPDFGTKGGAITLLGYNASWPESCPTGYIERKRAIGNPIGRIEFTNNIESNGTISGNQDYPSFFEKGHGERCHVINMNHKQIGTTAYRDSISPNVGQHYYDIDTEKEYICVGIEPSLWKEV